MALDNYTGKYTGAGQTIVVIDTGISSNYTNNNVVYSYDFADSDSNAINKVVNHGGQVANVAQQVASDVQIIHLKVYSDGSSNAYNKHTEKALQWVVENVDTYSITAVNLSLGYDNVQTPTTWQGSNEYHTLDDKGVIVTVASGNSKEYFKGDGVNLLSSSDSVLSVSAVNKSGKFTTFSQNHKNLTDIAALGEDVNMIDDKGVSHLDSGTSFSAPIIAAAAAIIQEAATVLLGHKITDEEFMDLIQKTGDKITGYTLHSGGSDKASSSDHAQSNKLGMSASLELDDNSIAKAQNIGALVAGAKAKVLQDSVTKTTDDKDFYKFELSANGKVDFLLSKLSADVDLNLYDSSGNLIYGGWDWGNVDIAYTKTLDAGVYFVEVDYYDGNSQGTTSTYDLSLTLGGVIVAPTPDTDNTIATAQNIGVLEVGTKVLQDSVTKTTDDKDFYKFTLTAGSQVDILLSKLSAPVELFLYASDGKVFYQGFSVNDDHITYKNILTAGVYFVKVEYDDYSPGSTMTSYDLSLSATPTDNTIATAQDIGVLAIGTTKVLQDSVTKTTDDTDFYKFTLTVGSQVDILLSKLSAPVELFLYASDGKVFYQGFSVNDDHITYKNILTAGVYFVKVEYDDYSPGSTMTSYDLSLSATPTDNTIATAQDIGVLAIGTTKVLQDSVTKTTDDTDFYKFTLTVGSQVDILLSKLSAPVELFLYASDGKVFYQGFSVNDDHVTYKNILTAGVYFVKVEYDDYSPGSTMTSYDLSLSAAPTGNTIATAQDIGVLAIGTTKVLQDSVTETADDKDFYKFELATDSKVDFLLSNLSTSVDLNLYNEEGYTLQSGETLDNSDVSYTKLLDAGTYYAEVNYVGADIDNQVTSTTYDLSLKANEPEVPVGYTQINLANAVAYLETHQSMYNDQIVL